MKNIFLLIGIGLFGLSFTANAKNYCSLQTKEKSCQNLTTASAEKATSTDEISKVLYTQSDSTMTDTITVYGNCGMCEKTIEGSLQGVKGMYSADWDKETDQMTVVYDPATITLDGIKQKIADVGYDSDTHRAKTEVYDALPGCCQYDRPKN